MSCRVFEQDSAKASAPVPWKQIHSGKLETPAEPAPEPEISVEDVRREWEQRARDAYAAGAREGEAAGHNRAMAELQPVVEKFCLTIADLAQLRARLRREAEADTLKLALAIARRVLRRELSVDSNALESLLLGALEKLRAQEISRIRVHPSHAALVSNCLRQASPGAAVEVISDASRAPGTAIFETEHGNLDASVESQLQEIERGLTDRLRNHP